MLEPKLHQSASARAFLIAWAIVFAQIGSAQDPPQPPSSKPVNQPSPQKQKPGPVRQGAQADQQSQETLGESIKLSTELVLLDVSVVDQNATPIFSLSQEEFTVFEDRVKQEIDKVSREEVPLSFGVVIDTSGSMRSKLQTATDAGLSLIKQMRKDDEAFIAEFKEASELVLDFTKDQRELEEALSELYTSGGTSLLDAIIATADYAHEKGKQRRKALIIITDGLDKNSSVKEKEVMEAIKEDEVQVYLVGFINEDEPAGVFGRSPAKRARELLTRLAEDSGGRAFFPKEISEMPGIATQIAKDMRTQWVVSYYPSNVAKDGKFRTVKVQVTPKDGRKLIARTRQGYYAKGDKDQDVTGPRRAPRSQTPQ